ncbi:hypothetical protein Tsubulata_039704 [Turnera subulata]|uniref:Pectinesterase inhibitor domain-containing protein n=1 Tax=Turnera subulata TaxID=218843 RepID=A0A9Q0F5H9_9ROSI|nr:hypothetical protein Tsubulata_016077 [Turnera subulata]KAJ4848140.1 hypothetical protein Tsubulata_039704 [Turnera subulata]
MPSSSMSSSITFTVSISALLTVSFIIFPCHGISRRVVTNICSQTQTQELCIDILEGDPFTNAADLPSLSLISLGILQDRADDNYNIFSQFSANTTDPALNNAFDDCVKIYQDIQDKVRADHGLSLNRQFKDITDLGELIQPTNTCQNGIPNSIPTADVSQDMVLKIQIAAFVNQYVLDQSA